MQVKLVEADTEFIETIESLRRVNETPEEFVECAIYHEISNRTPPAISEVPFPILHYDKVPIEHTWGIAMRLHEELDHAGSWFECDAGCDELANELIHTLFGSPKGFTFDMSRISIGDLFSRGAQMDEPMPDKLKAALLFAGIDPDNVTEWAQVGDAFSVRIGDMTDSVIITIVKEIISPKDDPD